MPAVVVDLETTGLDVRRDRIIQAAALGMLGEALLGSPALDLLVNPGVPIPAQATAIHGLGDADVRDAPGFAQVAGSLREAFIGRVVVGHHVGFDLAVLRNEAARAGLPWQDPPFLDIALLAGALEPSLPDQGLETIAGFLGVPVRGRHSAAGDARMAAQAFARLVPRLRKVDVRTLAEAQAFSARRADLEQRQAAAGWLVHSRGRPPPAPARLDTYIFERRVDDLMAAPPIFVAADASLREAASVMAERRIGALLVGTAGEAPRGIVTERDMLRWLARPAADATAERVAAVMSAPVHAVARGEMLYRALGRMDRLGMRHLCVVDGEGRAVGMLSQRDLLHHRARAALALGDAIATAEDAASLAAAYARVTEAARRLAREGLRGREVAEVISSELRALTARAAEITAARLAAGGAAAPAPWCMLVLGSGGRGESLLGADQDNALAHAGSVEDDAWFARLGQETADLLDSAGVPRCKGGVMAANAPWRGTLEGWRERVEGWLQRAAPEDLLNVDIFFDLAPVAGDLAIGATLQREALAAASHAPPFLALLAESAAAVRPATGFFGGLRTLEGRVDLKLGGLLPLVGMARTLALRVGSPARSTPERLRAAAAAGRLAEVDAEALVRIHARLLTLVLDQQLHDVDQGVRPSGRVETRRLGRRASRTLAADLRQVDDILQQVRGAVAG